TTAISAIHVVTIYFFIWLSFGFRYSTFATTAATNQLYPQGWDWALKLPGLTTQTINFARHHHLLPEPYLFGFCYTRNTITMRAELQFLPAVWRSIAADFW